MTELSEHYDVIISGAGPTGLMLANLLNHFKINFLIVDTKSGPTKESRALAVQSRSLEIYEQLGLSEEILKEGQEVTAFTFLKNAKPVARAGFLNQGIDISPFPFAMIYEQSKNEELLYNNLLSHNSYVCWNSKISDYKKINNEYSVTIQTDGIEKNIKCKYLCACDGSRSIIRDISGMPFTGGTYENVFYVADTHAITGTDHKSLLLFLSKLTIVLLFPMQGENRYRVLGILPKEYYHHDEITFKDIAANLKINEKIPFDLFDTDWFSTYKLHHKKVIRFNDGNVFFCGDAAHVHSPAGGQGMNTGLQDAYNLAWKLAAVINRTARPELLETYNEEREPNAQQLLKTTDRFFSVMIKPGKQFEFLRLWLLPFLFPILAKFRFVQKIMFLFVSQVRINYKNSSLSNGRSGSIKSGMRFPWFNISENGKQVSIYNIIQEKSPISFTLLTYNISEPIPQSSFYNIINIEKNPENDKRLSKKGFSKTWIALLRPDNYICFTSDGLKIKEMNEHLRKYFNIP